MNELVLLFCGDLAPIKRNEKYLLSGNDLFSDVVDEIQSADLSFVNLECPLTTHADHIKKCGPALKADPILAKCIARAGFKVVGLANNHIMDYGYQGLVDTIRSSHGQGLSTVGAGLSLSDAQKPYIANLKGVRVAIIAVAEREFNLCETSGVALIDVIENYHQIEMAKSQADIIIITLHGGNEYFPYPRPGLRRICKHYINLGVDAVICHHPHVPGAYEYYEGKPIIYSLGNFLFDMDFRRRPMGWDEGYMAKITVDCETKRLGRLTLIPYTQAVDNPGIKKMKPPQREDFLRKIEEFRGVLMDEDKWKSEWIAFCEACSNKYILRQYMPFRVRGVEFLAKKLPIISFLLGEKNLQEKLNLMRCESHRELLVKIMELRSGGDA